MRNTGFLCTLKKLKKRDIAIVMVLLLLADVTLMYISFARYYRDVQQDQNGVYVVGFSPTISEGEYEGNIDGISPYHAKSFTVMKGEGDLAMYLTITVTPEEVLPFTYRLFSGGQELPLIQQGTALVTDAVMPVGVTELSFTLVAEWITADFDERFGGLCENVKVRVLCEQWQEA